MNSLLRVAAISAKMSVLNPLVCFENIMEEIEKISNDDPDIIMFQALSMTSCSCRDMFNSDTLKALVSELVFKLARETKDICSYILVGMPYSLGEKTIAVTACIYKGEILGYVPAIESAQGIFCLSEEETLPEDLLPITSVFCSGGARFVVMSCGAGNLVKHLHRLSGVDYNTILVPSYESVMVGSNKKTTASLSAISNDIGCAIVYSRTGAGESSSPHLFQSMCGVYECGKPLLEQTSLNSSVSVLCDIDIDIVKSQRKDSAVFSHYRIQHTKPSNSKGRLLRKIDKNPYIIDDETAFEYVRLASMSLATRLQNISLSKLVIGVSGGLDSTLALLIAYKTMKILEIPAKNIVAITMPGFGTSDQTYYNALELIEKLKLSSLDIPINESLTKHFEDICHPLSLKDTTYENAQARERTQILLDMANKCGGLVVGTGDLSEEALGFATFGGDHLAHYNVNSSIPKTMIREIIKKLSQEDSDFADCSQVLLSVLDTPVSPELLPADSQGRITQKTEEILGPYELHDFFLYHFIKYKFSPSKILFYAQTVFDYDAKFIEDKLRLFFEKFFASQFKRSCSPDGAILNEIALISPQFDIPSDAYPAFFLDDLDSLDNM